MRLTLVRHAKSSWDDPTLIDFLRPLSPRGLRDAPIMADWLKNTAPAPDHWLTSPAVRARETAVVFAQGFGIPIGHLRVEPRIYLADTADWLTVIESIPPGCRHAIAFGHNPGIMDLIPRLTGRPARKIPTCAIIQLQLTKHANRPHAWLQLTGITTPKNLHG